MLLLSSQQGGKGLAALIQNTFEVNGFWINVHVTNMNVNVE